MAKKKGQSDSSNFQSGIDAGTSSFTRGLVSDYDENFNPDSTWVYARNAINNSLEGDVGLLGNESSNYLCAVAPYTIIGRIHLFEEYWAIFSTDGSNSEIGLYDEDECIYQTVVNDNCLEFSLNNLITGVAKENFDCSWNVYFADGKNPDRYINLGNPDLWPTGTYTGNNYYDNTILWPGVQWNKTCTDVNGCTVCTEINTLNCDLLRINSLVKTPCIKLTAGQNGGNIYNGSYLATIAYTINGQKYGDYSTPSNAQFIFFHDNIAGSLDIEITNLETESFTEFELVIISVIDQATVVRKVGNYATSDSVIISIDTLSDSLPAIPLSAIPIRTPLYETSESIFTTSNYLIRVSPRTTFDFNYQPLANQIETEWVAVKYPIDYYRKGGYVTGYMRDEVYAFWIRWIYNTGEKSNSYHIPGRVAVNNELDTILNGTDVVYTDSERYFEINNTASITSTSFTSTAEDGGVPVAKGKMAYWESTELYPDRNPQVWNSTFDVELSGTSNTDYDLCNKPIRHHKFPEDIIGTNNSYTRASATGANSATHMNIMGVQFSNIKPPVYKDENGIVRVVPGIVGYEILRSSRQGNKSVIAKGIINNMRSYPSALNNEPILYQNYPYNPVKARFSGGAVDPTLATVAINGAGSNYSGNEVKESNVRKDFFTFHSPDTSFYRPYLLTKELRLYTELGAENNVNGNFENVPGHPKHKLLTDVAFMVSAIIGMVEAAYAIGGTKTYTTDGARILNIGLNAVSVPPTPGFFVAPSPIAFTPPNTLATFGLIQGAQTAGNFLSDLLGGDFANAVTNVVDPTNTFYLTYAGADSQPGVIGATKSLSHEKSGFDNLPTAIKAAGGAISFLSLTGTAMNNNLDLIYALVKFRQYALRYISHGVLHKDSIGNIAAGNKRKYVNNAAYLSNGFDTFQGLRINNIHRSSTVVLNITNNSSSTTGSINDPSLTDTSVNSVSQNVSGGPSFNNPFKEFRTTASCYYTGLKVRFRNQYGQLDTIIQLPTGCATIVNNNNPIPQSVISASPGYTAFLTTYTSPIIFGGDTYIGRYTEKNTFFYFNDWQYNEPDGTEFDYNIRYLVLYPRYWADFTKYDVQGVLGSVVSNFLTPSAWDVPSNLNNLDAQPVLQTNGLDIPILNLGNISFGKKNAYFYLFQSGVRDIYVESEINIDQRDYGELDEEKHYPVLSYLTSLFDTRIIKSGNYFKINPSVSISRLFSNVTTWGNMQSRYYDPTISSLCYQFLTNRIIYSLPANMDQIKDFWRVFLPNNYKDFISPVTAIRPIGKNGALILFHHDSPVMFQGSETLETDIGTKLTIGDGQLFSQPLQSVVNSDEAYEYGSCQDKFSVINTPAGIYYISQNQGKIFLLGNTLQEISGLGKRWWFSKFLPMRLLVDFPDFQLTDNPVVGIGCQAIYDNDFQIVYFCKKDYELRKDLPSNVNITYSGSGRVFLINNSTKIFLGDPKYFNDVSWTISYDPKSKAWISYHDWHPDMTIPSKLNFISTKGGTMWRHNDTTTSYCNFYGVNYPFQIEYVQNTGQTVSTLKSIEYILESYIYDTDGIDRFQVLDYNFDELVIYNTEQVSGLLKLNSAPKLDPFQRLTYPQINADSINILYEKQEQKIRVNQFWDITDDRGEFNPNVQRPIWLTTWDGYKRELNPANLNYDKSVFERKKFRHYFNNVLFTKKNSGNTKMLMKIANNKNLISPR